MRVLRCLLVVVVLAGLLLGGVPAAEAKQSSAPVLDRPTTSSRAVALSGRAKARSVVYVQVRTSRWVTVRKIRATHAGRYRSVLPRPSVARSFRVIVGGRASTARVVPAKAKPKPPVVPAPDGCGARPAKRDGGFYACTFRDDFEGTSLDRTRWTGHQFFGEGNRCVLDNADTVAVAGGSLRLSAVPATGDNACPVRPDGTRGTYSSGWVSTHGAWSQQYGRFEARMKVQATPTPGLPGLHEGFWMWPDARYGSDTNWPITGEIDIAETYSSAPDLAIPFLHYSDDAKGPVDGLNTAWDCAATRGQWHTYTLEWTATRLEILVDGTSCLVNTAGASSFQKRFIIAFSQVLGGGDNLYDGGVPLPATTEVDYVKVWR